MKKRKIKLRFKLLLLTCFLVYAGISIFTQQANIGQLLAEQEELNAQYTQAQTDLERIEHQSAYMDTDRYVENAARDKFGLTYENEIILEPAE